MRRVLAIGALVLLAACSSGPTSLVADDLVCGQDIGSDDAKDTVEKVGGLRTDDYVVRMAKGTEAGVVALVDHDVEDAFDLLHGTYGVSIVARITDDDGEGAADGFAQIDQLTQDACG